MIPDSLRWWASVPDGGAWLERLPRLIADCAAAWTLDVGAPFGGRVSYVAPARREDGTPGRWLPGMVAAARALATA